MSDREKIRKLKEISFFFDVSEPDLQEIAAITTIRHYGIGEVIIEENSQAETFFIIYQGKIEILKKFEDGEEFVLGVYSDGEFFGEMAILDEGPRSATARAVEPTTVLLVSYRDFERILAAAPQIAYSIMKELSARLRQTGALLVWQLERKNRELTEASLNTVRAIVRAVEEKNIYMVGHSERVAALAVSLGRHMNLDEEAVHDLELGGLLHDVGMIGVNDAILAEPRPLKADEAAVVHKHPEEGRTIVEEVAYLKNVIPHILTHHERFDGSGYPQKIAGETIPLAGRIIAVADVYDALVSDRPHRKRLTRDQALTHLKENSGTAFDPAVVEAFAELQP
jgi:HD-GYP domain-containing protein (c-di-GMP phosphodiesterase class II)